MMPQQILLNKHTLLVDVMDGSSFAKMKVNSSGIIIIQIYTLKFYIFYQCSLFIVIK